MLILEAPVGRGGRNLVHDVAVVQAALAAIKSTDLKPLWPGPIDGDFQRHGPALESAITAFQQAQHQPENGRIDAFGAMPMILERVLPPSHKGLSGLKGTAVVFRAPRGFRPWDALAQETAASAPLPKAERQALAVLQKRVGEDLGLCLDIEEAVITQDGRFEVRLACDGTEWLDPATKRFRIDKLMPQVALRLFAARATGNATWRAAVRAGDHATFDLASARQIDALKGPARLDQAALDRFRITNPPMDPVADACIAGCARLLEDGGPLSTHARAQFDTLLEVLNTIARQVAKAIEAIFEAFRDNATQDAQQDTVLPPDFETFGSFPRSSVIETPNSGRIFYSATDAWSSAVIEARNLADIHYPEASALGKLIPEFAPMIPELGVMIFENEPGRFTYEGLIVGVSVGPSGFVGWPVGVDHAKVAGRGHMQWTDIYPSKADVANAAMFYEHRKRVKKDYIEWIGTYNGWRQFYDTGEVEE